MHAPSTPATASRARISTPATVLALALLGLLAVLGFGVVQQVRMAPGTVMASPDVLPTPTTVAREARQNGSAPTFQREGVGWETLNTPQKLALYPLAERWALLSGLQKRRWLALAQNFSNLPAEEQARLHERMTEWASLSAQQRNQARLNFAVTNRLAPDDKRTQWDAYQALSDEDKHLFAARGAAAKPHGAATALKPVSPRKLAKVPAALNAPGNPANPPKVPPLASNAPARIGVPGPEASDAPGTPAPAPVAVPAAAASAPASAPGQAPFMTPSDALPANPYLN